MIEPGRGNRGRCMSPGWAGRRNPVRATWRYCLLLSCLLLVPPSTNAQIYVHTVVIGVIPDAKAPLSPSPAAPAQLAPPASDVPSKVVDINGQPVNFDTGHADMAHNVIVDSFGGGQTGEQKARAAQQSAANLTANADSLFYRYSRAWDGSSFDAISPSSDPAR